MSVLPLEDTGELRHLAEQIRRLEQDPRRPGALDIMLLSVSIGAAVVVGVSLLVLAVASDRYPVDDGRLLLTAAASGFCVSIILAALFGVTRAHRKRHEQLMEELKRNRCGCPGAADGVDPKDLAMRSFETGRRIGRREADG